MLKKTPFLRPTCSDRDMDARTRALSPILSTGPAPGKQFQTPTPAAGGRLEAAGWRLEAAGWRLEAGGGRLEAEATTS